MLNTLPSLVVAFMFINILIIVAVLRGAVVSDCVMVVVPTLLGVMPTISLIIITTITAVMAKGIITACNILLVIDFSSYFIIYVFLDHMSFASHRLDR